jgi:hypothetical protein
MTVPKTSPSDRADGKGKKPGGHRGALLAGLALAVGGFILLRRSSSTSTATDYPITDTGVTGTTAVDDGGTTSTDTSSLDEFSSLVDVLTTRQDAAEARQSEFESETSTSLGDVAAALAGMTPTASGPIGQTPATAPGNTKAAAGSSGFWWGITNKKTKKTETRWITKDDKTTLLAEFKRKGVNVDIWAAKHPDAARSIGITPPSSPPPKTSAPPKTPAPAPPKAYSSTPKPPPAPAAKPKHAPAPVKPKVVAPGFSSGSSNAS